MMMASERRDMELAIRCLEVGLHPNTGLGETMAAIEGFRRKAKGTPLSDICVELYARGEMKTRLKEANQQVIQYQDENLLLKASLDEQRELCAEIRRRAEEAEAQLRLLLNGPEGRDPNKICRVRWSDAEYEFLASLYETDPKAQNKVLADRCSQQFGREISKDSIGSSIDRLRKQGRLPKYRPGHKRGEEPETAGIV